MIYNGKCLENARTLAESANLIPAHNDVIFINIMTSFRMADVGLNRG